MMSILIAQAHGPGAVYAIMRRCRETREYIVSNTASYGVIRKNKIVIYVLRWV
jgi:hypothetical protein